ncbi:hypothetical protein BGZ65_012780 [Modicella reniformis]|uniref:Uncharacterized protein n=1 Tax=Modicella reniformis TaxID=1440133 RepID=A0A9P6MJN1_9FUNG|nr:hypothetical protein BGZ65_012780 [Modicella reniformis]
MNAGTTLVPELGSSSRDSFPANNRMETQSLVASLPTSYSLTQTVPTLPHLLQAFTRDKEADRRHRLDEILQREDDLDGNSDDNRDPIHQQRFESQELEEDLAAQATAEGFCGECKSPSIHASRTFEESAMILTPFL